MSKAIATAAAIVILTLSLPAGAQQILSRQACQGSYGEVPIQGMVQIERWSHERTHRIYGLMSDPQQTRIEFEVFTNQPQGGVGGVWVNGMQHRATHMQLVTTPQGFVIYPETGGQAVFTCQPMG